MSVRSILVLALVIGCSARPLESPALDTTGRGGAGGAGAGGAGASPGAPAACVAGEATLPGTLRNARELGATPLADDRTVACGMLYRGGALGSLPANGCDEFASLGIRTIIDLRTPAERSGTPDAACATAGANVVPAPMPIPYNVDPTDYLTDLNTSASIVQIFDVLADETAYPVFVHCTFGRDRTGVVTAVVLSALGAPREVIQNEYALSAPTVGAYPNSLVAVLDRLRDVGGVEAFLASAGVTPQTITAVRAQLIAD